MEEKANIIESLVEKIDAYIQTSIEIVKLQAIDKLAEFVSLIVSKIIIFGIALMVFIMISIGLALWICDLLHHSFVGFFIIAFFYILLALLIHFLRKPIIKNPIVNSIIKNLNKD